MIHPECHCTVFFYSVMTLSVHFHLLLPISMPLLNSWRWWLSVYSFNQEVFLIPCGAAAPRGHQAGQCETVNSSHSDTGPEYCMVGQWSNWARSWCSKYTSDIFKEQMTIFDDLILPFYAYQRDVWGLHWESVRVEKKYLLKLSTVFNMS